jgi:N utilization substance protein B
VRRSEQRRAAVVALYQADVTGRPLAELAGSAATSFTRELAGGVERERGGLDALIERHSVGWTLDRIAPLERNILRVALFELLHRPDIPAEVAIDEAVEATKELCSADAPAFVNGVLGAVHREDVAPR